LQKHIVNDYATSTTGDGDKRAIKSCCDYDASKTPFDRLFGANVSKFSRIKLKLPLKAQDLCSTFIVGPPPAYKLIDKLHAM